MAWVVAIGIDADKANVGSVSAVFTDADGTTFVYEIRDTISLTNANTFVSNAVAARNAWQTQKTRETNAMTTLVARFVAAGEAASAGVAV